MPAQTTGPAVTAGCPASIVNRIDDFRESPVRTRLLLTNQSSREGDIQMPYVNIRITREGATSEQKAELIRGVTRLLQDTLGKNPETTVVVIDEVEMDCWGIGGMPVAEFRQRGS
jgi:4-oxalocrotonate tautomerase